MTNAVGGNIKVTLTLDDAGFTVKSREAREGVRGLNTAFGQATKAMDGFETKIGTLGKNVSLTSNNLKSLQATSKALESQFAAAGKSMAGFNTSAEAASRNAELLNGVVLKLARLLDGASTETNKATTANNRLATSQKNLASTSAATVNGLTAQERAMRNLGEAHAKAAQQVVLAAGLRKNEAAKAAADEINANNRTLASKKASLDGMIRAEREYQRSLVTEKAKQMALQQRVDTRRDVNGRMMGNNSPQLAAYQRELAVQNEKVAALQRGLTLINQEGVKLNSNINSISATNRMLNERIGLEGRIEAALQRQNQRARDYLATQRQQQQQARESLETSRQQGEMIKGLAQLYAGAKITQGEKASVRAAGEFERTGVRAKSMGMTAEEQSQFDYMTKYDSNTHPGLSFNDAATARIGAMGGLATTNQRQINQTLPTAIDAAQNIQYITGDDGHESFENYIRNLYGVAEARQVQYDPQKTKDTMELLQKIMSATGNKIDIPDVETLLRRIGPGGAAQLSDDGITNTVALLDQMKVSGGAGGGGAGGVSTVGTMFKMLQAYANGKTLSNEMVRQGAEAGILNTDAIGKDGDQSLKAVMSQAKKAGFKDSKLFNTDPVTAIRNMMAMVLGTISSESQKQKYFGDGDVNDPEAQRAALSKWATRNGMTTTASQLLTTIADPRMQERVDHQSHMIKGSSGIEDLKQLRMDTYEQQVKNFDAAMANLKVTLGTSVLPLMTSFFEWITKVVNKMQDFGSNNPMLTQLVMVGGAIGGVVLSLAGAAKMFGILGGLKGLLMGAGEAGAGAATKVGIFSRALSFIGSVALAPLRLLGSVLGGLGSLLSGTVMTSTAALSARMAGLAVAATGFRATMAAMLAPILSWGASIAGFAGRFLGLGVTMTGVAKVIGAVFLRMIPYVGWLLLAWDLTSLILSFEVGFASIGDWMDHWMAGMMNKAELWAVKFRNVFRMGDESNAEGEARIKQIEDEGAAEQAAWEAKIAANKKNQEDAEAKKNTDAKNQEDAKLKAEADAKKAEQGLQDMIAGKGFTHTPPGASIVPGGGGAFNMPDAPAAKAPRADRDQFARSLAEVTSKQEVTAMRITAQITGRADNLLEQARTEFFEKWKAGDFDPNHDSNKRPFKAAGGGLDWKAAGASGSVDEWVTTRAAMLQQEEQLKALTYANERISAAREDANTAMERGTDDTAKQTREMAGLQRELARTEERLKNGTKEFEAWNAKKNEALFERSRSDLVNFTGDFKEGDRETQNSMVYNSRQRVGMQFDTKAQKDLETYNARLAEMQKNYDAARAGVMSLELSEEERVAKLTVLDDEFNAARTRAETTFTEHMKVQANAREYAMRGSIEKMQQEWENSFDKLDEVAAGWGNGFVSQLSTWLTGGSVSIKSFIAGMLKDLLDMKLKEALAKPMSTALDGLTGMLSGLSAKAPTAGSQAGGVAAQAAGGGFMSAIGNGLSSAGTAVKGGINEAAKYFGLDKLAAMTDKTTDAVKGLATDGASAATSGLAKTAIQSAISGSADASAAASTTTFAMAVQMATSALLAMAATQAGSSTASLIGGLAQMGMAAYGGYGGAATATSGVTSGAGVGMGLGQQAVGTSSVFGFANGGIMSGLGALPLKAYANGGIANTPQLALFGEGKMNEAYVPLPDGRSIPVSFTGGGASTTENSGGQQVVITINIDKSGGEQEATSGEDDDRATGQALATKIKGVVREVLVYESRPNGLLDKRK